MCGALGNRLVNYFLHLFELGLVKIIKLAELSLDRFYRIEVFLQVCYVEACLIGFCGIPKQALSEEKSHVAQDAAEQLLG